MEVSNKTVFEPFMHKNTERGFPLYSPFQIKARRHGDEQTRNKYSSTCHAKIPPEISSTCRSKKNLFGCFMQTWFPCTCSGTLASGSHSRQNGFGKFFIVNARLGPVHFIHPSMLLTFAPTKLLCEQITETSRRTAEN